MSDEGRKRWNLRLAGTVVGSLTLGNGFIQIDPENVVLHVASDEQVASGLVVCSVL